MSGCIPRLAASHSPVFLLNSCLDLFSAPPAVAPEDPLSRSYGVSLPSSLTVNLSSASVSSTRPPVSVSGTGRLRLRRQARIFSGVCSPCNCHSWQATRVLSDIAPRVSAAGFTATSFNALFRQCACSSLLRLRSGSPPPGCGILTACPSTCPDRTALGPDLP